MKVRKFYRWDFSRGTFEVAAALPCPIPERLACRIAAAAVGASCVPPPRVPVFVRFVTRTVKELRDVGGGKAPVADTRKIASWGYWTKNGKVTSYTITVKMYNLKRIRERYGAGQALSDTIVSIAHEFQHIYDYSTGVHQGRISAYGNVWEFNAHECEVETMKLIARNRAWRKHFDNLKRQLQRAAAKKLQEDR